MIWHYLCNYHIQYLLIYTRKDLEEQPVKWENTGDLFFYTLCGFNFPSYIKPYITFIIFFILIRKRHLLKFQTHRAFYCSLPVYQTLPCKNWLVAKQKMISWRCWKMAFCNGNIAFQRMTLNHKIRFYAAQESFWSESKFMVLLMYWSSTLMNLNLQSGWASYFRDSIDQCMF